MQKFQWAYFAKKHLCREVYTGLDIVFITTCSYIWL